MQQRIDDNTRDVYEVTLSLTVNAQSVEGARIAADETVRQEGLAAGRLRISNHGPAGVGGGQIVFDGPGSSHASLDSLFEPEARSKANIDCAFEDKEDGQ